MIEINQISKSFDRKVALDGLSFQIPKGQIFGLLGPNGAGKTTLIRILNQIILPDNGTIRVDGKLLNESHWKNFGYLPEERGLYKSMKVIDMLVFLAKLRGMSNYDALKNTNYWLDKFDIKEWSNKYIASLSKGMSQKVQFIAAVVHEPEYLILDEPLSGFDPINVELILNELKLMKSEGKSIILSTHNMQSVEEICDDVVLLHKSKLIASDTVENLRSSVKNGLFSIRFSGNMIALANALWTDFELIETKELGNNRFQVMVRKRGERTFEDLINNLMGKLTLEAVEEKLPSMQEVFMSLITKEEVLHAE